LVFIDTIITSLGFGATFLLLGNVPLLLIERGRFLNGSLLLWETITAVALLIVGYILRKRYQLKSQFVQYLVNGLLIAIAAYFLINYIDFYIQTRKPI